MLIIVIILEPEKNINCILDMLKHESMSYPELESNWKATVNYRLNNIKNMNTTKDIFKNWKQYLIPYGHKLVSIEISHTINYL